MSIIISAAHSTWSIVAHDTTSAILTVIDVFLFALDTSSWSSFWKWAGYWRSLRSWASNRQRRQIKPRLLVFCNVSLRLGGNTRNSSARATVSEAPLRGLRLVKFLSESWGQWSSSLRATVGEVPLWELWLVQSSLRAIVGDVPLWELWFWWSLSLRAEVSEALLRELQLVMLIAESWGQWCSFLRAMVGEVHLWELM